MIEEAQGLHPFRYRITATLKALSPLHVGTGELARDILPEREEDGKKVSSMLALTMRDGADAFYLPGSTLKNLLRRAEPDEVLARCLFGEILGPDSGRMGSVLVWGARCIYAEPPSEAPYAKELDTKGLKGAFVAARTRIDRKLGVSAEGLLFFQEMIPAGSTFRLKLLVVGDDAESAKVRAGAVLAILRRLEAGSTLGKGQADGLGRVSVRSGSYCCLARTIGADGTFRTTRANHLISREKPEPARDTATKRRKIVLRCDGPFMVVDSSRKREERAAAARDRAHLKAQRLKEKLPLILGSSVMGALRSRAAWLAATRLWPDQWPTDPPDKLCRTRDDAGGLTAVQRLFGVTGFRGLLVLELLEVPGAVETWDTLTSVKLDRFSGAPVDGGLFTSAVFVNVTLALTLALHDRSVLTVDNKEHREVGKPTADDEELAEALLKDIRDNGLMLGHATNRGFGWFDWVTDAP
jgi:CRISPR/Cas system CSM-associated protein Csm3 (group 7 of RAMP superfamily)